MGIDWLNSTGLEKEAESVKNLKQKFIKRVPEFENINADFLSMTLETLEKVMFERKVYKDTIVLDKSQYAKVLEIAENGKNANNVAEFIKSNRTVEKDIWNDLFVPYIENPEQFKQAIHNFTEDRNHVAHSKVLSWSSYQIILGDFNKMDGFIRQADAEFESKVTSDEVLETWDAIQEEERNEREYYRERIANEAGVDILDADEIKSWFDEVIYGLYSEAYQRYHLDVCYEISDYQTITNNGICFTIVSPVLEDNSLRVDVTAEYSIDDDLGEDSTCEVACKDGAGRTICSGNIYFHNGNGYEGEECIMEASENSERNILEMSDPDAEVTIDEYMVACYGTTEYPEDMTSVVLKCEGADEKTIHYAYKCRSEVLAGATAVSAVVPPIDTKVSLTASSTDAEGYIEEGYAFSPMFKLGYKKTITDKEVFATWLNLEKAN